MSERTAELYLHIIMLHVKLPQTDSGVTETNCTKVS